MAIRSNCCRTTPEQRNYATLAPAWAGGINLFHGTIATSKRNDPTAMRSNKKHGVLAKAFVLVRHR